MPKLEDALICALQQPEGVEKRAPKKIFNPFTPELITRICQETKEFWEEEIYGPCNGQLQSQRTIKSSGIKLDIPTSACDAGN